MLSLDLEKAIAFGGPCCGLSPGCDLLDTNSNMWSAPGWWGGGGGLTDTCTFRSVPGGKGHVE